MNIGQKEEQNADNDELEGSCSNNLPNNLAEVNVILAKYIGFL